MTAKEWLNKGRKLNDEVEQLLFAKQQALDMACNVTSCAEDGRVQTSQTNNSESKFLNYAEYSEALDRKIDELYEYRVKMLKVINLVDDTSCRALLVARYINCKTWEDIAEDIHYTLKWVHILHGRALQAIRKRVH